MNVQESIDTFRRDRPMWEARGVSWDPGAEPRGYYDPAWAMNPELAMDAVLTVPAIGQDPNSGIPALYTTYVDPQVYEFLFAPNAAAEIFGEERKGSWIDDTAIFPSAEANGEVSSYGDFNNNGRAGVNVNFPSVQNYLWQLIKEWGEREAARMGAARINWVSQIDRAAAINLNKYANFVYFFGVVGLNNYGALNNPYLSASLTPATKAAGGTAWTNASNQVVATANEIFNDIQTLLIQLIAQNAGLVTNDSPLTLALSPVSFGALTATNTFNVNVRTLLEHNFPKLKINGRGVNYQAKTSSNPQGIAAGNLVQLIADEVEGQKTAYCAFSEKMRAFPILRELSGFRQKMLSGAFGTIMRMPSAISSMVGV